MLFKFILDLLILPLIVRYFYLFFKRIVKLLKKDTESTLCKIILITICLIIGILCLNPFGIGMIITLHFTAFALFLDLIMHIANKKITRNIDKLKNIYNSGIIPLILTILTMGYAYWNMIDVVEQKYTIYTDKKINNEYKVALISDLHFGTTMDIETLEKYVRQIEEENPDFVILAGDIVDERTTNKEMKEAFKTLGSIGNKYGIFYVYGNHDKSSYRKDKSYTEDELETAIKAAGIIPLVDEIYTINEEITLIGRDDASFFKETKRESAEYLINKVDKEDFLLMIDHQPIELEKNASLGYDLQVSGHTHGGQLFPIGIFDELLKINEMNYGYRKIKDFQIIVSSGIGGWAYPLRTISNSEYVIINIKNNN